MSYYCCYIYFILFFCEAQVWNVCGERRNQKRGCCHYLFGVFFGLVFWVLSLYRIQAYASNSMNKKLANHIGLSPGLALLWSVGFFRSHVGGWDLLRYCGGRLNVGGLMFSPI